MDLFFLRHGEAAEKGVSGVSKDSERPLTREGMDQILEMARGMKAMDLFFDWILSSPFVRARQTAEIVAEVFKTQDLLEETQNLVIGADPEELIREVGTRFEKSVLLVGHEPFLSRLISVLVGGESGLSIVMKKGGLCKLTLDALRYGRCAQLEWLISPDQMQKIR